MDAKERTERKPQKDKFRKRKVIKSKLGYRFFRMASICHGENTRTNILLVNKFIDNPLRRQLKNNLLKHLKKWIAKLMQTL